MLIGISDQMGTRFDRLRCEVFQNLILSPMNTGLLRPAVATVLTVYGIETLIKYIFNLAGKKYMLQQSLPFTVLKLSSFLYNCDGFISVATVLTVYGIETVDTVDAKKREIAKLQQSLPFTVLKRVVLPTPYRQNSEELQQSLPFTVLKL